MASAALGAGPCSRAHLHRSPPPGGVPGAQASEAFLVRCDRTTMTQADIDSGRLVLQVGVAPLKPAEFVLLRICLHAQAP